MTSISRMRIGLTGFSGAPGVMTFYCLNPGTSLSVLVAFANDIKAEMPPTVTLSVEGHGDVINDTDGVLTGSWTASEPDSVVGIATGVYAAPAGASIAWLTETILDGRRIKGRTYVVPMATGQYQSDGSLDSTQLGNLRTQAAALVTDGAGDFVVWHRPRAARAAVGSRPAVTARAGGHAVITGSSVADKVAVLRSRRD